MCRQSKSGEDSLEQETSRYYIIIVMLKYLFQANFSDGTFIQQTQDDQSTLLPEKSAFYDVLQRQDDLVSFGLFSDETPTTWIVDLRDGHFEVNEIPFMVYGSCGHHDPTAPFRLIYFRKVRRHFHIGNLEQIGMDMSFHFGWQTTVDGKNHQKVIEVF
jgi:hypothetical protein